MRVVNKKGEDDKFFNSLVNIEQNDLNDSAKDKQTKDTTNQSKDSDVARDEPKLEVDDPSANEGSIYVGTSQMRVTEDSSTSHTIPENVPGEEHPLGHGKPVVRVEAAESRKRLTSTAEDLATKNPSGSSGTGTSEIAKVGSDSKGFFFLKGQS